MLIHTNSTPSNLTLPILLSGIMISPDIENTIMYDAILPLSSSDFNATMNWSCVPGMNFREEKPCVGLNRPIRSRVMCWKSLSERRRMFVARCSSSFSVYISLLARRGRKNHCLWMGLHNPDSWIMYPVATNGHVLRGGVLVEFQGKFFFNEF